MDLSLGRVIARFSQTCLVAPESPPAAEEMDDSLLEVRLRRNAGQVVCGDLIEFEAEGRVVKRVQPRSSSFARADRRGRKQIIAANLDLIIVVVAPKPEPTRDLVNRYLVACHDVGIDAALFLNKTDLLDEAGVAQWQRRESLYQRLGLSFLRGAAKPGLGIEPLRDLIGGRAAILVGQSGVGKSSLINRLVPDLELRTQRISDSTGKGRHTTTTTTYYPLPDGGAIIDSPGVWEYGLWQLEPAAVAAGFVEFAAHTGDCRFANCTHTVEPDCGLELAVDNGVIEAERLASFRRIVAALPTTAPGAR